MLTSVRTRIRYALFYGHYLWISQMALILVKAWAVRYLAPDLRMLTEGGESNGRSQYWVHPTWPTDVVVSTTHHKVTLRIKVCETIGGFSRIGTIKCPELFAASQIIKESPLSKVSVPNYLQCPKLLKDHHWAKWVYQIIFKIQFHYKAMSFAYDIARNNRIFAQLTITRFIILLSSVFELHHMFASDGYQQLGKSRLSIDRMRFLQKNSDR